MTKAHRSHIRSHVFEIYKVRKFSITFIEIWKCIWWCNLQVSNHDLKKKNILKKKQIKEINFSWEQIKVKFLVTFFLGWREREGERRGVQLCIYLKWESPIIEGRGLNKSDAGASCIICITFSFKQLKSSRKKQNIN